MIEEIRLRNYRCFEDFKLQKLSGVNVIVGDNGVGKTALLEGAFLVLCTSSQKVFQLRQWRGVDPLFPMGTSTEMFYTIFGDLFRWLDTEKTIHIDLKGDGAEARSLNIFRGKSSVIIRPAEENGEREPAAPRIEQESVSPIEFEWIDHEGHRHLVETRVTPLGIQFQSTGETLPQFYLFTANTPTSSTEAANLFSALRRRRREKQFIRIFSDAFHWIESMSVESYGGSPALHATIRGADSLLPLPIVSGAINRIACILLAIANSENGIVMVDEIENGIFYRNHTALIKAILEMSREYNCQLVLTTHSNEWLSSLSEALDCADDEHSDDVTLYRFARDERQPTVTRVGGRTLKAGLASSGELR